MITTTIENRTLKGLRAIEEDAYNNIKQWVAKAISKKTLISTEHINSRIIWRTSQTKNEGRRNENALFVNKAQNLCGRHSACVSTKYFFQYYVSGCVDAIMYEDAVGKELVLAFDLNVKCRLSAYRNMRCALYDEGAYRHHYNICFHPVFQAVYTPDKRGGKPVYLDTQCDNGRGACF